MSNIQDMNNRLKQNRDQRPSKRAKFKENNRENIYSTYKNKEKPNFKTIPETELKRIKKSIRKRAAIEQKKEQTIFKILIVCGLIALIGILIWLN